MQNFHIALNKSILEANGIYIIRLPKIASFGNSLVWLHFFWSGSRHKNFLLCQNILSGTIAHRFAEKHLQIVHPYVWQLRWIDSKNHSKYEWIHNFCFLVRKIVSNGRKSHRLLKLSWEGPRSESQEYDSKKYPYNSSIKNFWSKILKRERSAGHKISLSVHPRRPLIKSC